MIWLHWLVGMSCAGLLVYLGYALLNAEVF